MILMIFMKIYSAALDLALRLTNIYTYVEDKYEDIHLGMSLEIGF
jgi:hypothetical protein